MRNFQDAFVETSELASIINKRSFQCFCNLHGCTFKLFFTTWNQRSFPKWMMQLLEANAEKKKQKKNKKQHLRRLPKYGPVKHGRFPKNFQNGSEISKNAVFELSSNKNALKSLLWTN